MQSQKKIQKYQFNLKKLLGQGSYASVYRGKVIETGYPVAVKVIDKRIFTSSFNLKNLQSQIDIMKKVNHRNIVNLFDVFQTNNNMYIITEICDYDLYNYLKEKRKLQEDEAIIFLKQIMKGLKYLNINNIIHRDLKPANILLKSKECKISDFGFAKNIENDNSLMKSVVGTPLYMSPQILQKEKYTNKSDLWSIGLIFYEMIHGKTPWMANSQMQLIKMIFTQKVLYSRLISDMSKDFISRCLAINEKDRMTLQQAFDHPLLQEIQEHKGEKQSLKSLLSTNLIENKSAIIPKNHINFNSENNSHLMNVIDLKDKSSNKIFKQKFCLTPKMRKNISEIKLKKVQALTPKASFSNINNRLKQVWALNQFKGEKMQQKDKRQGGQKVLGLDRRKKNMTAIHIDLKDFTR